MIYFWKSIDGWWYGPNAGGIQHNQGPFDQYQDLLAHYQAREAKRSRESADVIETAELLGCIIAEAAWNGLSVTKETLRASVANVEALLRR